MGRRVPEKWLVDRKNVVVLLLLSFFAWAERLPDGGDGGASRPCGRNVVDGNWRYRGTGAVL